MSSPDKEVNPELLQALTCAICLDHYASPRALLCGHTFCRECLEQMKLYLFEEFLIINCPWRCKNEDAEANRPISVKNIALSKILETFSQVKFKILKI